MHPHILLQFAPTCLNCLHHLEHMGTVFFDADRSTVLFERQLEGCEGCVCPAGSMSLVSTKCGGRQEKWEKRMGWPSYNHPPGSKCASTMFVLLVSGWSVPRRFVKYVKLHFPNPSNFHQTSRWGFVTLTPTLITSPGSIWLNIHVPPGHCCCVHQCPMGPRAAMAH
jgi:hypothetical protein